ncbi:STY4528 family pathogenicity island replication protein [Vreelandella olivaria]|uniref:STY4528 family pathogenicity island replication protein n=1 Tax=Vreelandella olivaria TaxID=390919 RepID=UPI00201F3C1A|nr:STY4528 family pathogenicity island replication protein [Halomonas olivaria]
MSRIEDWEILVGRAASAITQRRGHHASALEHGDGAHEHADGLVFLGNVHETVPRGLLLDRRLGAVDVLGWQMIRLLCNADRTTAFPSYDELQPLLRSSIGTQASRGTVARVMAILRLTRWLSLSHRARHATNGRVIGNVYVLHDEPVNPADASILDREYFTFVEMSLRHSNRAVREVAEAVRIDLLKQGYTIESRKAPATPRSMDLLNRRARRFQEMQPKPSSQGEPGQFSNGSPEFSARTKPRNNNLGLGSQSEPRQFPARTIPSSQSELSLKSITYRLVPIANSALTTVRSSNNNLRTCNGSQNHDSGTWELFWSDKLEVPSGERRSILRALEGLAFDLQQAVLDETAGKVAEGKSSSPMGLLHTLIKRAAAGEFRPTQHAQQQAERRGQRYIQATSGTPGPRSTPTSPLAQTDTPYSPQPTVTDEEKQQSKQVARAAREQMMKALGLKRDKLPPALR